MYRLPSDSWPRDSSQDARISIAPTSSVMSSSIGPARRTLYGRCHGPFGRVPKSGDVGTSRSWTGRCRARARRAMAVDDGARDRGDRGSGSSSCGRHASCARRRAVRVTAPVVGARLPVASVKDSCRKADARHRGRSLPQPWGDRRSAAAPLILNRLEPSYAYSTLLLAAVAGCGPHRGWAVRRGRTTERDPRLSRRRPRGAR